MDFSMRTQGGEREEEWSRIGDGRVRGGKEESEIQSEHTPPHTFLHSPHCQASWTKLDSYSIFPKLNLCLSSAHWHAVTLEGFSHHKAFGAGWYDLWHCLPLWHKNTHSHKTMNRARKVKKSSEQPCFLIYTAYIYLPIGFKLFIY